MPISAETLKVFGNSTYIESGHFFGSGVQAALDAGIYDNVVSIELAPYYADYGQRLWFNEPKVRIYQGDSRIHLPSILAEFDQPCTIYLDAHYSGGPSAGAYDCPLLEELRIVAQQPIKHTVLVDDLHLCNLDIPSIEDILIELRQINSNHFYYVLPSGEPSLGLDVLAAVSKPMDQFVPLSVTGPYVAPGAYIIDPNIASCGVGEHTVYGRHYHCARCDAPVSFGGHDC